MKKIIIFTLLILFVSPKTFAATSSFKTFTPAPNYYNNYYNNYNNHRRYLPPPPPPSVHNNQSNKYWKRRNYYNNYYNSYNNPYYYQPKQSVFSAIGDFFSSGKMTGYTDSNFDNIDIPYGYQTEYKDANGNYYKDNYGYQSGASVKILD